MTRNGKIVRLPKAVREKLNERLANGEAGAGLVDWLNELKEVKRLMAEEFDGEPVNKVNLSRWRQGGFRDWSLQQETRELVRGLADEGKELMSDAGEALSDRVGVWLAARYAVAARKLARDGEEMDWGRLRELCNDVVALRRSDHGVQRLKLQEGRLDLEKDKTKERMEKLFKEWAKDPKVREEIVGPQLSPEEKERRMKAIFGLD